MLALLALGACGTSSSEDGSGGPLKMGLPPGEANPEFQEQFTPLRDLISKAAGRPVETTLTSDYLAIVEAMRSELIDIAAFSPFPTPLAQSVAGVKPLVVAKGAPYSSVLVCRTDRGIDSIDDLRGRTVAFVDPGSTSGNYIPKLLLKRAGINPETDIEATYAGGHDTAQLAVKQGSADCAADARTSYEEMVEKGVIDGDQQKIITESEPIPVSLVIIARKGLDPEVERAVVDELVNGDNGKALEVIHAKSFAKATDADFTLFREAARELGVDLEELSRQ
ncbi:phosphate/phosphite/phosphonate ABC transporter substrate-binding protein [Prauserella oleivorans]